MLVEVVYLFCEFNIVRIPFYGYDRNLFHQLVTLGGVWDKEQHHFVFTGKRSVEWFRQILPDIPCAWVEENAAVPIRLFGLWEQPWAEPASMQLNLQRSNEAISGLAPLPGKFPEYWQVKLDTQLRSRKYSHRTLRAYLYYNHLLCRTIQKIPEEMKAEDITRFLAILETDKEYSASSMNLAISAIKFFYKNVIKKDVINAKLRPRQDRRLPVVLSKEEISIIFSMEKNPKHRLLLMLVYSSGLRVSEVVALKKEHIDISRGVIYIRLGKGRKDRCTVLSQKAACFITEYCSFNEIKTWLFPGQPAPHHLTIRSAQKIFNNAVRRAKINKEISIHSLRHTFATHLLESGTDIRYIQALLGHSNIRTTERYTHIAKGSILNIKSPLDTLL